MPCRFLKILIFLGECFYAAPCSFVVSSDTVNCFKNRLDNVWNNQNYRILSTIIRQRFTESETEMKWYFDIISK